MVFDSFVQLWFREDPSLKTSQTNSVPSGQSSAQLAPNLFLPSTVTVITSTLPLFNFSQFMILAAQRGTPQLFVELKKKYNIAISQDPELSLVGSPPSSFSS